MNAGAGAASGPGARRRPARSGRRVQPDQLVVEARSLESGTAAQASAVSVAARPRVRSRHGGPDPAELLTVPGPDGPARCGCPTRTRSTSRSAGSRSARSSTYYRRRRRAAAPACCASARPTSSATPTASTASRSTEALPKGAPPSTRDGARSVPQRAHRRRALPDRAGRRCCGRPTSARSTSTPGRCAAPTPTSPTSCASTSTRSPAPTSPTPCRRRRAARGARRGGARGLAEDLGRARHPRLRADPPGVGRSSTSGAR